MTIEGVTMGQYKTRIAGPGIKETLPDDTERTAVNQFAELLAHDTTERTPIYPKGTILECRNAETDSVLTRYVVGYE